MKKIEVNTINELKKTTKEKADEIVVKGELIDKVKKATSIKTALYWIIFMLLLLCFNIGISSKVIDFYKVLHLNEIGISRTNSIILILLIDALLFVFGLMKSKVSRYKISYIDRIYKGSGSISLLKVWYF